MIGEERMFETIEAAHQYAKLHLSSLATE